VIITAYCPLLPSHIRKQLREVDGLVVRDEIAIGLLWSAGEWLYMERRHVFIFMLE
jgi:hypothetical protein